MIKYNILLETSMFNKSIEFDGGSGEVVFVLKKQTHVFQMYLEPIKSKYHLGEKSSSLIHMNRFNLGIRTNTWINRT